MDPPDAARFFPPGTDPADINPTLPRKSDVAKTLPRRLGSFASDESANDLVNRTLKRNKATVDMVATGKLPDAFVTARFGSITGREIYRPDPSEAYYYFRNTYGAGVYIIHDPGRSRGYRVHTAYPRND